MKKQFKPELRTFKHNASCITYSQIPWDTQLLGYPTHEVISFKTGYQEDPYEIFNLFLSHINFKKNQLIFAKFDPENIEECVLLQKLGFYFIETFAKSNIRITNKFDSNPYIDSNYFFRTAVLEDLPELKSIASEVFGIDRYHRDPYIDKEAANNRSKGWVQNSLNNDEEKVVCLCEKASNVIAGFYIIKISEGYAGLQLIGLSKAYQGKGLGKGIHQEVMVDIKSNTGLPVAHSAISMTNGPALYIHHWLGTKLDNFKFVFHYTGKH